MQSPMQPGLRNTVADAQAVFRAAMNAMARPGRAQLMPVRLDPPPPLTGTAAALVLALCDFETCVWLDPALAADGSVAQYVRFHTGARLVAAPAEATYAVIADGLRMPPLTAFAQGTAEYPDRSATLIVQVAELRTDGWRLAGPGLPGHVDFSAHPLPDDFADQVRANRRRFPCGVDIVFATGSEIAALPRSTHVKEAG